MVFAEANKGLVASSGRRGGYQRMAEVRPDGCWLPSDAVHLLQKYPAKVTSASEAPLDKPFTGRQLALDLFAIAHSKLLLHFDVDQNKSMRLLGVSAQCPT